jgi:hypothetical protein
MKLVTKTGLMLLVMINKTSASRRVIFPLASRAAQFLLPIGKPNRKPLNRTKAPLSLTGMSRDTSGAVILFRYCR